MTDSPHIPPEKIKREWKEWFSPIRDSVPNWKKNQLDIKYNVTSDVNIEDESFVISVHDNHQYITRELFRLKEEGVKKALIALGWTPPPEKNDGK